MTWTGALDLLAVAGVVGLALWQLRRVMTRPACGAPPEIRETPVRRAASDLSIGRRTRQAQD